MTADDRPERRRGSPSPRNGTRDGTRDGTDNGADNGARNGRIRSAATAVKIAVREIAALTGRAPDNIVSVERREDGWCVAVELVETHRIPDTADILAIYETELDHHGEVLSYRRTRRYLRGRVQEG